MLKSEELLQAGFKLVSREQHKESATFYSTYEKIFEDSTKLEVILSGYEGMTFVDCIIDSVILTLPNGSDIVLNSECEW